MRCRQIMFLSGWMTLLWAVPPQLSIAANAGPDGERLPAGVQGVTAGALGPLYQIHANPYFRATVTNWGEFGNFDGDLIDSATLGLPDTLPAPGFEAPAHSRIGYLYQAGLWVGGIVGNDTLVSVGAKGWPPAYEFHPEFDAPPVFSDTLGDEEYTSVYTDTLTDPLIVRSDEINGPHRPIPVKVRQTTRLVSDPLFDKGMTVEVVVTNIGSQTIHDMWLGWYIDCDVWHPDNANSWLGDLSGYRTSTLTLDGDAYDIAAAWSADNSGDPDSTGAFNERSPLGVFGAMFLESNPQLPEMSFNWWNIGFTKAYDWGPTRNPADTNYHGWYGRPIGDAMRYRRMSNHEIDYDQVYAAKDFTAQGWIPPTQADVAQNFADGYDTRFLHTRGAVDLLPGDSVIAVWTWVVAPGLHTDPANYADNFDYNSPELYLAGLNFTRLDTALARMRQLWDSRFAEALVGPPRDFRITGWDDASASMVWLPRSTFRLNGYEIYRSIDPGVFSGEPVAVLPPGQSALTDNGLSRLPLHYYMIRSADDMGRLGLPSPAIDVLPDRPQKPNLLGASRGDGRILVTWDPPAESDVVSHRVYRRTANEPWAFLGETFAGLWLTDCSVVNAIPYEYEVTAISALGSESYPSNPALGIAFSFNGPPLVIDHTLSGGTSLTIKDSVAAVWQRMTAPVSGVYRDADPATTLPFGLETYDTHPATFIVSDGRGAPRPEWKGQIEHYLHAGGIAILSGRDLFNQDVIAEGTLTFGPGDLPYDDFGITAAYYPRVLLSHPTRPNAEFIAARPLVAALPYLQADSARTVWGLSPTLPKPGPAIPFVGFYDVDTARAEVICEYVSRDSLVSFSQRRAVGIVSRVPGVHAAVLSFPLCYMDEPAATELVRTLLLRLGWIGDSSGDLDGDGYVTAVDLTLLIDYVFFQGSLENVNNADVNADCVVNLVDVVIIIDHVFLGGAPLRPGCALP